MSAAVVMFIFTVLLGLAVVGTDFQNFAIWKLAVYGLPFLCFFLMLLLSRDRLKFLLLGTTLALPFLGLKVPPASLGLTVFDVLSVPAVLLLLVEKITSRNEIDLVPLPGALLAIVLLLPSLAFSVHVGNSMGSLLVIGEIYVFFVILAHFLRDETVREQIHINLALALIVVSLFVFVEKMTGINFNFGAAHVSQFMQLQNLKIHRVAGIFQDPQKAAQFLSVFITYLAILCGRRAFRSRTTYVLAGLAIALAVPALVITVTRAAIISGLVVTTIGLLLFSRSGLVARLYMALGVVIVVAVIAMTGTRTMMDAVFPEVVIKRFEQTDKAIEGRVSIWKYTMQVFGPRLVAGVGPGNYKEYMMQDDPRLRQLNVRGGYVADMPESGYFKILYEVGVIGSLGCLLLAGHLAARMLASLLGPKDELPVSYVLAVGAGLSVFLVTFVTIFTVADMRNAFILPFLAASAIAAGERRTAFPAEGIARVTAGSSTLDARYVQ